MKHVFFFIFKKCLEPTPSLEKLARGGTFLFVGALVGELQLKEPCRRREATLLLLSPSAQFLIDEKAVDHEFFDSMFILVR